MARPKKPIDPVKVEALAALGCTSFEIGAELAPEGKPAIDHKTIERRFGVTLKKAADRRKCRIRSWLHKEAAKGNTAIIIFLAKCELGYKEPATTDIHVTAVANANLPPHVTESAKKQFAEIDRLMRLEAEAERSLEDLPTAASAPAKVDGPGRTEPLYAEAAQGNGEQPKSVATTELKAESTPVAPAWHWPKS
jgi:hypothetical protein